MTAHYFVHSHFFSKATFLCKIFVSLYSMRIGHIILYVIVFVLFFPFKSQATEKADTLNEQRAINNCKFNAKHLILPGTLIAVGASSLFFSPMEDLDHSMQKDFQELRSNHHSIELDEYLRFLPIATNYALHFTGVKSGYDTREQLLLTATSFVTMYALTQGLKHTIDRKRPDGSDNHSFPSGHVATAFLGAEQLRMNYGTWWGLAGYSVATGTAFLRLYNNRHWFSDVIGAAGIGILSARIGYWLLPWEKCVFGLNKNKSSVNIFAMPTFDTYNSSYGLAMTIQF